MTQGTHTAPADDDVEDLDVLITSRSLDPKRIRVFGRVWTLRRSFTAAEMADFWVRVGKAQLPEAFALLVGPDDAKAFAGLLTDFPAEVANPMLRRLYRMAGLLKRDDQESVGDSPAS